VPIYEFTKDGVSRVPETTFGQAGVHERRDLQRMLRERIEVVAPEVLVIAEEFGEWDDSRRRIDLLAIDKSANLVVIELKRTEDGGHMELQSIRYAAMVSTMTFDQASHVYERYLDGKGSSGADARAQLLEFLEWEDEGDEQFAPDVRIVLVSAEFSREVTSSVLWLIDHGVDVRCVRLRPYDLNGRVLMDVQQIIPLPEAAEYQVQVREKSRKERLARVGGADFTRYDLTIDGETHGIQWKRNAIYLACRKLCDIGVAPDEISALFDWRANRVWYPISGSHEASEFQRLASENADAGGPAFDPRRWFSENNELVRFGGYTYAFSKMWGGDGWHRAMKLLRETYPRLRLEYVPATTA
jgi:hypothetical protein